MMSLMEQFPCLDLYILILGQYFRLEYFFKLGQSGHGTKSKVRKSEL